MSLVTENEAEARYPTFTAGGVKDNLAWAKRLVFRVDQRNDKDVKRYQIEAAREALKNHQEESK